jgi:pyridoxine/pyridoxamine 5'-phosphate oxidase
MEIYLNYVNTWDSFLLFLIEPWRNKKFRLHSRIKSSLCSESFKRLRTWRLCG